MATAAARVAPPREKVIAAFAALYFIWGSTYLGIRYAIETIPPFLMSGTRFIIAGALLFAIARARHAPWPTRANWRATLIVGTLLFLGGNGGLVWAQQRVPSGIAALMLATIPLWMVLLDWLRGGEAPHGRVVGGLVLGFAGVALLIGPARLGGAGRVDPIGGAVLILSAISWATGAIYSREMNLPSQPFLAAAMEMLCGGAVMVLVAALSGEFARFQWAAMSTRSAFAVAYLIFVGALIGFSAFVWLMSVTSPARVSTYAYVNPLVAVFLGWAIAGEQLSARILLAAAITLSGVALIIRRRRPPASEIG